MGFKDKLQEKVNGISKAMKPGSEIKNLLETYALEVGNVLEHQDKDIKWIRSVLENQTKQESSTRIISFISIFISIIALILVFVWKV